MARRGDLASGSSALAGDIATTIGSRAESTPRAEGSSLLSHNAITQSNDELAAPRKRRGLPFVLIGGAAAAVVVAIVMVVALRGGNENANDPAASSSDVEVPDTVATRAPQDEPGSGSQMRLDERARARAATTASAGSSATEAPVAPEVTEPAPAELVVATVPAPPPARRASTLGGKKVVLEYDTAPKEKVPAVKKGDAASIGAARITYFNGNRKLFAGDADGAIKLYRQALAMYPGYVAGYRGLGLAYAQKGDKPSALKAFRTYIAAVPGAKDVALVKKRIAVLQR